MRCSKQQSEQQQQQQQPTEELSNVQPDVVYAHIVPSQEQDLGNNCAIPNDYEIPDTLDTLVYSELKSKDDDNHAVSPSGDLYAQVQKR